MCATASIWRPGAAGSIIRPPRSCRAIMTAVTLARMPAHECRHKEGPHRATGWGMTRFLHQISSRWLGLAAGLCLLLPSPLLAQATSIQVDWQSPEIAAFVRDRAANPPVSLGAGSPDEAKLARLKLPVLAFDTPP